MSWETVDVHFLPREGGNGGGEDCRPRTADETESERVGKNEGRMGGEGMAAGGCRGYQLDDDTICKALRVPMALVHSCAVMATRPGGAGGDR